MAKPRTIVAARAIGLLIGTLTLGAIAHGQGQCGPAWIMHSGARPPGRTQHCMAYDIARNEVVMFGGVNCNSQVLNDTWVFNGVEWVQRFPANPPPPRVLGNLAYDPSRQRCVLYGGTGPGPINPLIDTWEWDGVNWGRNVTNHPGVETHRPLFTAMCPIDIGGQIKMVIPSYSNPPTGSYFGGNWVYDTATWMSAGAGGFLPRAAYTLAYDSNRNRAILFGGNRNTTWYNDVLEWSGAGTWAAINTGVRPDARNQSAACFDPTRGGKMIVFGGYCGATPPTVRNDTWEWDGTSWTNTIPLYDWRSPSPRYGHAMVFDTAHGRAIMFGGYADDSPCSNETWWYEYITAPSFAAQPMDAAVTAGDTFSLSASVNSALPATYQWIRNGVSLQNGGRISGANSTTLTITGADLMLDSGSYTLRASNACGNSPSMPADVRVRPAPPRPFNLALPAPGAVGVNPVNIRFDWQDSVGADFYTLILDDDADLTSPILTYGAAPSSEVTPTLTLSPFTTYYWTVDAVSMAGGSTRATPSVASFTTAGAAPPPPALDLPTNGAFVPRQPSIRWNAALFATSYTITIDDTPDLSSPIVNQNVGNTLTFACPLLNVATTYYWSITAHNASGSTSSSVSIFHTTGALGGMPRNFTLLEPANGDVNLPNTEVRLDWSNSLYSWSYSIIVATDAALMNRVLDLPSYTASDFTFGFLSNGTYYWRVSAENAFGTVVANPSIASFTIGPPAPGCVADVDDGSGSGTPDGGVTIDDLLFYLALFENGDIRADVDDGSATGTHDGGVTIDDLLYYLFRFESGC